MESNYVQDEYGLIFIRIGLAPSVYGVSTCKTGRSDSDIPRTTTKPIVTVER